MSTGLNNATALGRISLCLIAAGTGRVSAADVDVSKLPPPAAGVKVDFTRDIRPLLEANCLRCHGPEKPKSGFRLDNRTAALKGGETGVDIVPGDSAKSPLIHYVAYLVPDSEMPPVGKGPQLNAQQVSLLRAWIDQGAIWDNAAQTNKVDLSVSPILGGTVVSGDSHKFREHYWQKEGINGGLEQFELFTQNGPDTRTLVTGHALLDDYKITLSMDRNDLGFVHSGWEQYRKYYDDTGGYAPSLLPQAPVLGQDLHLDIGKAWVDFGLTLPDWPRMVLGYEYDYRLGNEATAQWGAVGANFNTTRGIAPASERISEGVNIIKFDLDHEIQGVSIEERFRGEFYHLTTGGTNTVEGPLPESLNEGTTYFQGANTIRLEKKFSDWFLASAGYLVSKLDADSSFNMEMPTLLQQTTVPRINLERESHVGNINGLLGPFDGLTISTGAQAEWTRQNGFGTGTFDQEPLPPSIGSFIVPFNVASEYDQTSIQETAAIRYSKIPFTSVFAEGRLEQQSIGQYDQFGAAQDILNKAVFLQHTAFSSQSSDLRVGFNTSPWQKLSFSAHYRRYDDDSHYNSDELIQPILTAYPAFIRTRDVLTDEAEAKLVYHPFSRVKLMLSYQYQTTEYDLNTSPYLPGGNIVSPGGQLISGEDKSHTISFNASVTPTPRLHLSTTFSYRISDTTTAADDSPAVAPYRGDIYTVIMDGTYVLTQNSDIFGGYAFSEANYGQDNFAAGLPLGIQYQQHNLHVGLARHIGRNFSTKLQYRFNYYDEPTSGGATDYRAHAIFGVLTYRFL